MDRIFQGVKEGYVWENRYDILEIIGELGEKVRGVQQRIRDFRMTGRVSENFLEGVLGRPPTKYYEG